MKKQTLQKKLDKLGDRLKEKHPAYGELLEIVEYKLLKEKERKEIDKYLMERHSENPYDLQQKGKLYDALKILCDQALAKALKAEIERDKCIEALKDLLLAIPCGINNDNLEKSETKAIRTLNNK